MALFNEDEARYFFSINPTSIANASFRDWGNSLSAGARLSEGASEFDILRVQSHREVERLLLLGANHYRRTYDLLSAISAPWAFVTLYYGSYFVANALLGALGAWMLKNNLVLQASTTSPGSQRFDIFKRRSSYNGSHQRFWDFYFANATLLYANATAAERFALLPISADPMWLITNRNDFNYDTYSAIKLSELHKLSFVPRNGPSSLPGELNTQLRFVESLLVLTNRVVQSAGISSDAISALCTAATRSQRVRELVIRQRPPSMARSVPKKLICG